MVDTVTKNFKFVKPAFNKKPWQQNYWDAMDSVDAILSRYILVSNFTGVWANATAYTIGQRALDVDVGAIYTCLVAHTSNAVTSFSADRLANPSFWTVYTFSVAFRGAWVAGTDYGLGDFVTFGQKFAIATTAHHSSASFTADQASGLWSVIIDGTALAALPTGTIANADQVIRYDGGSLQYQLAPNTVKLSSAGVLSIPAITIGNGGNIAFGDAAAKTNTRTNLGVAIGSNVQAWDADLDALAALDTTTASAGAVAMVNGTGGWSQFFPVGLASFVRNGDMRICQRALSNAAPANGVVNSVDGWNLSIAVTAAVLTQAQVSNDHPLFGTTGAGFSLAHTVTTADAVIAAGKLYALHQPIEGNVIAPALGQGAANPNLTAAFWVKSPKTGIHCVALRSSGADRSFVMEYTVTAANTWERKVVTFAIGNAYASGTWVTGTGVGLYLAFPLMAGSTFQTGAAAWQAGNFYATANQQNLLDTNGNVFKIADVALVQGTAVPVFERLPFPLALSQQQRYLWKTFNYATAPVQNAGSNTGEYAVTVISAGAITVQVPIRNPVAMRAAPTATFYSPVAASAQASDLSTNAVGTATSLLGSEGGGRIQFNSNAAALALALYGVHGLFTAELA